MMYKLILVIFFAFLSIKVYSQSIAEPVLHSDLSERATYVAPIWNIQGLQDTKMSGNLSFWIEEDKYLWFSLYDYSILDKKASQLVHSVELNLFISGFKQTYGNGFGIDRLEFCSNAGPMIIFSKTVQNVFYDKNIEIQYPNQKAFVMYSKIGNLSDSLRDFLTSDSKNITLFFKDGNQVHIPLDQNNLLALGNLLK